MGHAQRPTPGSCEPAFRAGGQRMANRHGRLLGAGTHCQNVVARGSTCAGLQSNRIGGREWRFLGLLVEWMGSTCPPAKRICSVGCDFGSIRVSTLSVRVCTRAILFI